MNVRRDGLASRSCPRGVVMFMALATLAIVSLIAMTMVRGAMIARRSMRCEHALRQVDQILDAAVARATARLTRGLPADETVELSPGDLGGQNSARVIVTTKPRKSDARLVRIVAEYPCEGPVTVCRSREIVVLSKDRSPPAIKSDQEPKP